NRLAKSMADYLIWRNRPGADVDQRWYYLEVSDPTKIKELARRLYEGTRSGYEFVYSGGGRGGKLVHFNPETSTFTINSDHEFVKKHEEGDAEACLEDFVIAETMLEVYLREEGVSAPVTGEILQRRDELLRALARDQLQSPSAIATFLEDSANNQYDLEIALVVAARLLGFTASHVSGAGKPDGVAVWIDHPRGARRIVLEAKSSDDVPSLGAIDFAGLRGHVNETEGATGCLLLAPDYPGGRRNENARAAKSANEQRISCWTIGDLVRVVKASQARHINAEQVIEIVETVFEPEAVRKRIDALLEDPEWDRSVLAQAIIDALREMEDKLEDRPRSIDQIATAVVLGGFPNGVKQDEVKTTVIALAAASQGAIRVNEDGTTVRILTSIDELRRRTSAFIKKSGTSRKPGRFRKK
ncbi:MAG: hypothetical protein WDZ59_10190, partial [Pirellulales bacterium]